MVKMLLLFMCFISSVSAMEEFEAQLRYAASVGVQEVVRRKLEEYGLHMRIDGADEHGQTALTFACMSHAASSVEVVKILLAAGANINHRQKCNGQTPLTLAILHGNEKVVQALFDHGTLDLTNYNPEYLLSLAAHAEKEKMYNLLATCINKTKHKVA